MGPGELTSTAAKLLARDDAAKEIVIDAGGAEQTGRGQAAVGSPR